MRLFKMFLGILLLPMCAAMTLTALHLARALALPAGSAAGTPTIAFCVGYALWLMVFVLLPQPIRTYVLGHELTHALWALLMGARVSGLRVGKSGGQVRTSKSNWAIVLAPYFFPFYAMLFIGLFFLVNVFWSMADYGWVLFFLVGLGWSFHVTFTLMTLLTVSQPDVQSQGVVFSVVVIYLMNLLFIVITAGLLSREARLAALAAQFWNDCGVCYGWTLDKLALFWHSAASWLLPNHRSN
jgi:hypothetical protein